jgi:hypothetical protein
MAAQVRGPFSSSLWEISIPQSSHAESYIQHAMIAVSAMNKALRDMRAGGEGIRSILCENPSYIYALKEYDKNLRCMREAINKIKEEMKNALFACFLVFCFENMSRSSRCQRISGLMVLRDLITKTEGNFPLNFRRKGCREQHNPEHDVKLALVGLDLHVVFFVDRSPEAFHQISIESFSSAISSMPEELRSLQSAMQFWAVIMGKNHHSIRRVLNPGQTAENSKSCDHDEDGPWEDGTNLSPRINMFFTLKEPRMDMFPDVLRYWEDVRRWKLASATVFENV